MLRNAAQDFERKAAAGQSAFQQQDITASSPKRIPTQPRSSQNINPAYRAPLKQVPASAMNGLKASQERQKVHSGTKRTASGLAKAFDGSFEDGLGSQYKPIVIGGQFKDKSKVTQVSHNDFIEENDFDSDVDLDVEEPKAGKGVVYPSLNAPTLPVKPIVYPTLPRQQQQAHTSFDADIGDGYDAVGLEQPKSSAPLPWSSSPSEHFLPSFNAKAIKRFTYDPTESQHAQNEPPPPTAQARPAKRRYLPWEKEEKQPEPQYAPRLTNSKPRAVTDSTPQPPKSSKYLWNTSASAVKEQQKVHRRENFKNTKKSEGDDDTVMTIKTSRDKKPAKVFLSEEQQHVLDLVVEQKKSVFFTGSAGTGKSVLMREIISNLRRKYAKEPDRVAVTASTGLAACNVGGVTLHSFAGIGLGKEDVPELVRKIRKNQKAKHRWLRTKVLIVDEISMVDGDLFDKLEAIARTIRNNGRPFGGIQIVVTGDFFQLPPVPDQGRVARFAFDAATWKTTVEHTIALHHVFRQKDPIFAGMLNEMREGRLQQSSINAFRSLSRPLEMIADLEATELFPTRNEVENANNTRLRNLQGEAYTFPARDGGLIADKMQRDKLLQNCMAPETIVLKKGCQVMLIKNIDESLVNGSIGRVMGFMDEKKFDTYTIKDGQSVPLNEDGTFASSAEEAAINGGVVSKQKMMQPIVASANHWPVVRFVIADGTSRDLLCQPESYKIELPNGEIQASRLQIPLILAWALSIHKAQGQTLERVKVDLGKVFEKGQAYVALSRATNMAGLQVLRFDPKKVMAHETVRHFYANLSRVELAEKNKNRMDKINGGGKGKGGIGAEDYEKMFVQDDDWSISGL